MKLHAVMIVVAALTAGGALSADGPPAKQGQQTGQERKNLSAAAPDAKSFCYFDSKPYSEGAVVEGRECKRGRAADVFSRESEPLSWQPVRERE